MLRPGDRAWIALGAGVLTYDVLCSDGNTMSETADTYMVHHPWLTRGVAFALAAHVCNLVAPKYDAVHWLFVLSRKWRRP
jgi:hypothetical protein